jgi:hypothetical protein
MDDEQKEFKIIITQTAEKAYLKLIDYLFYNYSSERAIEIANEILLEPLLLKKFPERGKIEPYLEHKIQVFRFLLYKRSNSATVKIVYYINESDRSVYITDFFPTEMSPSKMDK